MGVTPILASLQVWNRRNQLDLFTTIPGWITLAMSTQVNFAVFRRAVKLSQSWSSVSCCGITEVGDFFFWPICLKPPLTGWLGNILCEEFLEDVASFPQVEARSRQRWYTRWALQSPMPSLPLPLILCRLRVGLCELCVS